MRRWAARLAFFWIVFSATLWLGGLPWSRLIRPDLVLGGVMLLAFHPRTPARWEWALGIGLVADLLSGFSRHGLFVVYPTVWGLGRFLTLRANPLNPLPLFSYCLTAFGLLEAAGGVLGALSLGRGWPVAFWVQAGARATASAAVVCLLLYTANALRWSDRIAEIFSPAPKAFRVNL